MKKNKKGDDVIIGPGNKSTVVELAAELKAFLASKPDGYEYVRGFVRGAVAAKMGASR